MGSIAAKVQCICHPCATTLVLYKGGNYQYTASHRAILHWSTQLGRLLKIYNQSVGNAACFAWDNCIRSISKQPESSKLLGSVCRNTCKVLLAYWDFSFIKLFVIYGKICHFGVNAFKVIYLDSHKINEISWNSFTKSPHTIFLFPSPNQSQI